MNCFYRVIIRQGYIQVIFASNWACINQDSVLQKIKLGENMQLGFNENVIHKGIVYHIQTEDGGRKNPVITTLVFKEGIVMSSKRTSYADIIKSDKLELVVKEIMRDQHGAMLKNLKDGVFDKKEEAVQPQTKPAEKLVSEGLNQGIEGKEGGPLVSEKSLDDIILEYLSMSEKG